MTTISRISTCNPEFNIALQTGQKFFCMPLITFLVDIAFSGLVSMNSGFCSLVKINSVISKGKLCFEF